MRCLYYHQLAFKRLINNDAAFQEFVKDLGALLPFLDILCE